MYTFFYDCMHIVWTLCNSLEAPADTGGVLSIHLFKDFPPNPTKTKCPALTKLRLLTPNMALYAE